MATKSLSCTPHSARADTWRAPTGGVYQHLYLNNGLSWAAVVSIWSPPALPPLMISLENKYQDSDDRRGRGSQIEMCTLYFLREGFMPPWSYTDSIATFRKAGVNHFTEAGGGSFIEVTHLHLSLTKTKIWAIFNYSLKWPNFTLSFSHYLHACVSPRLQNFLKTDRKSVV